MDPLRAPRSTIWQLLHNTELDAMTRQAGLPQAVRIPSDPSIQNHTPYQQRIRQWIVDLLGKKPISGLSLCTGVGGLTILAYLLGIGFLPDFTLSELIGLFAAAFMLGLMSIIALTFFCLMPGFVTRRIVEMMEARLFLNESAADVEVIDHISYQTLTKGGFIVIATLVVSVIWSWAFTSPLRDLFGAAYQVGTAVYALLTVTSLALLAIYGNPGRAPLTRATASVWFGTLCSWLSLVWIGANNPYSQTESTSESNSAIGASGSIDKVYEEISGFLSTYGTVLAILSGIAVGAACYHLSRPSRKRVFLLPDSRLRLKVPFWLRHCFVKFGATLALLMLAYTPIYLAAMYAELAPTSSEITVFIACLVVFSVANWFAFATGSLKQAIVPVAFAMLLLFYVVPLWVGRPLFLADVVVRGLGYGGIRVSTITLSGKHCATLERYGAHCDSDPEKPVQLTEVNMLSRIGSTVLLELQIISPRLGPLHPAPKDADSQHDLSESFLHDFVPDAPASGKGCDTNLMSRLRKMELAKSEVLRCIRLAVPKSDVASYVTDGARRYTGSLTSATSLSITNRLGTQQ